MKRYIIFLVMVFMAVACDSKPKKEQGFLGIIHKKNYLEEGKAYLKEGKIKEAVLTLEEGIKKEPQRVENYLVLSEIYLRFNNLETADAILTTASQVNPQSGEVYYLLGFTKALEGKREEALELGKLSTAVFMQQKDEEKATRSASFVRELLDAQETATEEGVPTEKPMTETMEKKEDTSVKALGVILNEEKAVK